MALAGRLLPDVLLQMRGEALPFTHAAEMTKMVFQTFVVVSIIGLLVITPFIASNVPGTALGFTLIGCVAWFSKRLAFRDPVRAAHLFGFVIALIATFPLLFFGRQPALAAVVIFSFIPTYAAVCGLLPAVVYVLGFVAVTIAYSQVISAGYALPLFFPLLLPAQIAVIAVCALAIILPMPALFRSMAEERRRAEAELQMRMRRERQLEQANAEADAANRRLRDFSHSASDGFWETDGEHRLTYVSRQETSSGTPSHLAIGRFPWAPEVLAADPASPEWQGARSLFASRVAFRDVHLPYRRVDRSTGWISVSGIPLSDAHGRFTGFRGTTTDITARKRAEIELLAAREAADAASRAKSDFLTNMSHEIRTPLNAIMGLTQLALESPLAPRQADYIRTVHASANVLLQLINDILDLAKIEAGRLQIVAERLDIRRVLEEAWALIRHAAAEKGLQLRIAVAPAVPALLLGDDLRIRQILFNLLGNALKFTERGEITVEVTMEARVANAALLRFVVRDTGIGMAPAQVERLFAPFTQGDESISRRFGGSGLGLSISRRLAEAMGGAISVESAQGSGSTFTLSLRLGTVDAGVPGSVGVLSVPAVPPRADAPAEAWRGEDLAGLVPQLQALDTLLAANMLEAREACSALVASLDGRLAQTFLVIQQQIESLRFKEARQALGAFFPPSADCQAGKDCP